jgi:hypothetical protein
MDSAEPSTEWKSGFVKKCKRKKPQWNTGCWQFVYEVMHCPVCDTEHSKAKTRRCIKRKNHLLRKSHHLKVPRQRTKKVKLTPEEAKAWEEYVAENNIGTDKPRDENIDLVNGPYDPHAENDTAQYDDYDYDHGYLSPPGSPPGMQSPPGEPADAPTQAQNGTDMPQVLHAFKQTEEFKRIEKAGTTFNVLICVNSVLISRCNRFNAGQYKSV